MRPIWEVGKTVAGLLLKQAPNCNGGICRKRFAASAHAGNVSSVASALLAKHSPDGHLVYNSEAGWESGEHRSILKLYRRLLGERAFIPQANTGNPSGDANVVAASWFRQLPPVVTMLSRRLSHSVANRDSLVWAHQWNAC